MSHETTIILDRMVLVKVEASIYGARKKLKKEDLVLANGSQLPPEDLASLGSKRLLDPEQLAVFNRLKQEAERLCLRIGTRFLGGYALPKESASEIMRELERIAGEFLTAKSVFLAGYETAVQEWIGRHPAYAEIIAQAVDSVEFVSTRLSFDYVLVSIGLPDSLPAEEVVRLEHKVASLSEQMFYEIAADAALLIEQSLIGKDYVTRHAVRPIRRMRDKLDGLGFLDYRVAPVVNTIDGLLSRIPSKGVIDGSLLQEMLAIAMLLADPDKIRRHGEGLLAVQNLEPDSTGDEEEGAEAWAFEPVTADNHPVSRADEEKPVVNDSIQLQPSYTELFAGIFDDTLEGNDDDAHWLEGAVSQSGQAQLPASPVVQAASTATALKPTTTENTLEPVTKRDYWF